MNTVSWYVTTIWFSASASLRSSSERGSEDISCKNDPAMTAWNSSALDSGSSASVMARRYVVSSSVISTPVRMARLSSFDTTRATRFTMEANCVKGMDTSCCTST